MRISLYSISLSRAFEASDDQISSVSLNIALKIQDEILFEKII
jgi:hypothetical protein